MASCPEGPCCVGVVRSAAALKGVERELGELVVYSSDAGVNRKNIGVVLVHDIFGFIIPNCKYLADFFAGKGFDVCMPDFFRGDNWPATETTNDPLEGDKWKAWFNGKTTEPYLTEFRGYLKQAVDDLKAKGNTKVALVGVCYGGLMTAKMVREDASFYAFASCHGAHFSAEDYTEAKADGLFISVPDDAFFPNAVKDGMRAAGAKIKEFPFYHGFMVRGDFANNEALKAAADEAACDIVAHLDKAAAGGVGGGCCEGGKCCG